MNLKTVILIISLRVISKIIKVLSLGAGSTWPGHIALRFHKNILEDLYKDTDTKVILLAGTNGKTTSSTLLRYILEKNNKKVIHNGEGANLLNGIVSTSMKYADLKGKVHADYAVFEVDENTLPHILRHITPEAVILLNLFRDQLDRYGEVNTIARNWKESILKLPKSVNLYLNADDPQINYLGKDITATVHYFGLSEKLMEKKDIPHDVDSIYCPVCGEKFEYEKMSYSHLGIYLCPKCGFGRNRVITYDPSMLQSSLKGVYNLYNISSIFLLCETLLDISVQTASTLLVEFTPAFGRQETLSYKGKTIFLLLSKNPTGFNQSIAAIKDSFGTAQHHIVLLLNDRIPDGRDISWIWDVEFQNVLPLAKKVYISGDRGYDMALRLKYALDEDVTVVDEKNKVTFESVTAYDKAESAIEAAVENSNAEETIAILATYSAMLETREYIVGKKLL